jgi:hypothetical protein
VFFRIAMAGLSHIHISLGQVFSSDSRTDSISIKCLVVIARHTKRDSRAVRALRSSFFVLFEGPGYLLCILMCWEGKCEFFALLSWSGLSHFLPDIFFFFFNHRGLGYHVS